MAGAIIDLEDSTPHYAETLRRWRQNFMANIEEVKALDFSSEFVRMWEYYLRTNSEEKSSAFTSSMFARISWQT